MTMKILCMGTAAEGWPTLFCSCPVCAHAREAGGRNLRTRTQALLDGSLLLDFPPDTYSHALQYGLNLGNIRTLLVTHGHNGGMTYEQIAAWGDRAGAFGLL